MNLKDVMIDVFHINDEKHHKVFSHNIKMRENRCYGLKDFDTSQRSPIRFINIKKCIILR